MFLGSHSSDFPFFRKLVLDAAVAAGNYPVIEAVGDYISQGKLTDLQIMTTFMAMTNNIDMVWPRLMVCINPKAVYIKRVE